MLWRTVSKHMGLLLHTSPIEDHRWICGAFIMTLKKITGYLLNTDKVITLLSFYYWYCWRSFIFKKISIWLEQDQEGDHWQMDLTKQSDIKSSRPRWSEMTMDDTSNTQPITQPTDRIERMCVSTYDLSRMKIFQRWKSFKDEDLPKSDPSKIVKIQFWCSSLDQDPSMLKIVHSRA